MSIRAPGSTCAAPATPPRQVPRRRRRFAPRLAIIGVTALTAGLLGPAGASAQAPQEGQADQAVADLPGGAPSWQAVTFGQSTDLNFSSNVLPDKVGVNLARPEVPGTIEGDVFMESRGGKLAPGHDGLTFYHVTLDPTEHNFVLEADVTVHQLGPETGANPSGQEGAGLMVRDVNGGARQDPMLDGFEEVPAASNYASTSVLRQGPVAMTRTGVVDPWGTVGSERRTQTLGSQGLPIGTPVTMRLERTDTSFLMSATYTHLGTPQTFTRELAGADWVQDIDPGIMTVGFFASRNVAVTFSDASLTLTDADTRPRPQRPEAVVPASFDLRAPSKVGSTTYPLVASAGYPGSVDVSVDGVPVATGLAIDGELRQDLALPVGRSTVTATYVPSAGPDLTPITRSIDVTVREFGDGPLVVAPTGTPEGEGTVDSPLDLTTAVTHVLPGQAVELTAGTYQPTATLRIAPEYAGTPGAPKTLTARPGATVVIDGRSALPEIMRVDADHWVISNLELTRAAGNGMRSSGSHNVFDSMVFSYNGGTGFQLSGSGPRENWPADNLIVNSEAHDNRDASDINADGFAAKLGVGPDNVFRGNVSHHNIDDGWDLYNRTDEGPNFPVVMENNIAHHNGRLSNGYNADSNVGTGFKVGGEGLPVDHVLIGNLAYANNLDGFSDNFNPGRIELTNNTAVDNKRYNFIFRINPYFEPEEQGVFRNNLSIFTGKHPRADQISGNADRTNVFHDGSDSRIDGGKRLVSARDFMSLKQPAGFERAADGSLVFGTYTQPTFWSFLATGGQDGHHIGAVTPVPHPKAKARR